MNGDQFSVDRVLAEWVLGQITPKEAQQLAVGALEKGCDSRSVAVIAGMNSDSRADVEDELPGVLRDLRRKRPTPAEALKILVDDCARRIAGGEIDPIKGAWKMWHYWANEDESRAFFDQVSAFIGLASECDQPGPHVDAYRADIVDEARAFLERGGLQLRSD